MRLSRRTESGLSPSRIAPAWDGRRLRLRRVALATEPPCDRWHGVAVVALGLPLAAIGILARIPDIVTYGMPGWLSGLAPTCFGLRRGLLFWPALAHLSFMPPLPNRAVVPVDRAIIQKGTERQLVYS